VGNNISIHEAKIAHVEKFFKDIADFCENDLFNYSPPAKTYQRLIKELQSKLAIEDAVYLLNQYVVLRKI